MDQCREVRRPHEEKRGPVGSAIAPCRCNHTNSLFLCQKGLNVDNVIWFKLTDPLSGSKALLFELPGGSMGDVYVDVLIHIFML